MTRDAYVNEFMGYLRDDLPRKAFKLLIRYGENLVTQLRGEAGKRQVKKAKIGLAHNVGGSGATAAVHILRKL